MLSEGDLVKYHWPSFLGQLDGTAHDKGIGVVLKVETWADPGAPERNCGVHVVVHWSNGTFQTYEEDELKLLDDFK